MAARRRRGTIWRSSKRRRAKQSWFQDFLNGGAAPIGGAAGFDPLLAGPDYSLSLGGKESVTIRRILIDCVWSPDGTPSTAIASAFNVDVALYVAAPDVNSAVVTAGLNLASLANQPVKIIRGKMFNFVEQGQLTAVGVVPNNRKPVQFSWNIRTNIRLSEPDTLYLYFLRTDISNAPSDTYEYSYRSRVLFER